VSDERTTMPPPFAGDPAADWRTDEQLPDYDPVLDTSFLSDVITAVLTAGGEWCHPGRIVLAARGGTCDCHVLADATHYAIDKARRLGLVIDGDTVRGYRFVRFEYVPYVRPARVLVWPPRELPTQLTIAETVR
jgi:hypothetical protein